MGVKFGEVDANQILVNEYRIQVLEGIVQWILTNNSAFVKDLTDQEMRDIRQKALRSLQEKYPKSGIELRQE